MSSGVVVGIGDGSAFKDARWLVERYSGSDEMGSDWHVLIKEVW